MASNRVFYAVQSVELAAAVDAPTNASNYTVMQGVQSVGLNTNFNLEPVYQLGHLELYDNFEEIPEVEITLNKVLDGKTLMLQQALGTGSLVSNANKRTGFRLNIYEDTGSSATGSGAAVTCNPAYVSSVTYTFPTEGNSTEEITLVSNDKVWSTAASMAKPSETTATGIVRRNLVLISGANSKIPYGVSGGIPSGIPITNVTISMNLGREEIRSLGSRIPIYRYINFPVEITCDFEVVARNSGDQVGVSGNANAACDNPKALDNKEIKIALCDGTIIDLGSKNKLRSVNYTGGDTGGGNATMTYSYVTYNDFVLTGPSAGGGGGGGGTTTTADPG